MKKDVRVEAGAAGARGLKGHIRSHLLHQGSPKRPLRPPEVHTQTGQTGDGHGDPGPGMDQAPLCANVGVEHMSHHSLLEKHILSHREKPSGHRHVRRPTSTLKQ